MARKLTSAVPFEFKKVGDKIKGTFERTKDVDFTEKDGRTKTATGAILKVEDGSSRIVWLSALLRDVMEQVNEGDKITITFTGEKPAKEKGRSPTKLYEVEIDD